MGLFGKRENYALFEGTSALAFRQIEESVRIDLIMSICRLGDGLQSCGDDNLTFARLENHYKTDATLKELVRKYGEEHTSLFRTHRHNVVVVELGQPSPEETPEPRASSWCRASGAQLASVPTG